MRLLLVTLLDPLAYLRKHGAHFGVLLVIFLGFVHWLVIQANTHNPPRFPESLLFLGMAAFLVGLVVWLGGFIAHFRQRSQASLKASRAQQTQQMDR